MTGQVGHGLPGARCLPGHGEDLELGDRDRPLAMDRPEAVGPGVAAPDDHHPLSPGVDGRGQERALATRLADFK